MSQISDAYADYEANKGLYRSESPTFGSKGRHNGVGRMGEISRLRSRRVMRDHLGHRGEGVPRHPIRNGALSEGRTRSYLEDKGSATK